MSTRVTDVLYLDASVESLIYNNRKFRSQLMLTNHTEASVSDRTPEDVSIDYKRLIRLRSTVTLNGTFCVNEGYGRLTLFHVAYV